MGTLGPVEPSDGEHLKTACISPPVSKGEKAVDESVPGIDGTQEPDDQACDETAELRIESRLPGSCSQSCSLHVIPHTV